MSYKNPCRLWYEFLRRTDINDWSEKVKQDFAGTHEQDFETWLDYDKRCRMFAPHGPMTGPNGDNWIKNLPVRPLSKGQGIDDVDHDTHLILVIDQRKPYSVIMESIERKVKLVTEAWWLDNVWWNDDVPKESKSKHREWEKSKALYPLASRPDLEALELTLLIHDIHHYPKNDEWHHWNTGVEAKKTRPDFQPLMKYGNAGPDADEKIKLGAAVIRILDRAKRIKGGVVQGIFPAT